MGPISWSLSAVCNIRVSEFSLHAAYTVVNLSTKRVGVLFWYFFVFLGIFWVLGLQEGRKQGRKQQPERIGRKDEGREGRKEGSTEGGQERRKEGSKEGGQEGRKEGLKEGRDRIFVHICAGNTGSDGTFC